MYHATRSKRQAMKSDGILKLDLNAKPPYTFYTLSAWHSFENVKSFLKNEPHLSAIRITKKISKAADTYRWESDTFPTWDEAINLLEKNPKSYIR